MVRLHPHYGSRKRISYLNKGWSNSSFFTLIYIQICICTFKNLCPDSKTFSLSTWAVWLHHGHSRTSWPLTWAYKKIPLVTVYWNLLSLSSIVEGFVFSCYAIFALAFSILIPTIAVLFCHCYLRNRNIVVMMVTCCSCCRWGMLVDHSSSLKAEVGRWKGQGGWRPHPCQRVLWEIPGKTLFTQNTLLLHNAWFRHVTWSFRPALVLRPQHLSYASGDLMVDASFMQTLWNMNPIMSGCELAEGTTLLYTSSPMLCSPGNIWIYKHTLI